jgi:hypothetical protein
MNVKGDGGAVGSPSSLQLPSLMKFLMAKRLEGSEPLDVNPLM